MPVVCDSGVVLVGLDSSSTSSSPTEDGPRDQCGSGSHLHGRTARPHAGAELRVGGVIVRTTAPKSHRADLQGVTVKSSSSGRLQISLLGELGRSVEV